jgi:hypothetical protein
LGAPKSEASNATIGVTICVVDRIHRLKGLTVEVRTGNAIRKYKVVNSDGPDDLVFQGVQSGGPLRDNNILIRFIKPAARSMELPWVNFDESLVLWAPALCHQDAMKLLTDLAKLRVEFLWVLAKQGRRADLDHRTASGVRRAIVQVAP